MLHVLVLLGKFFVVPEVLDALTPRQLKLNLLLILAPDLFEVLLHGCRNLISEVTMALLRVGLRVEAIAIKSVLKVMAQSPLYYTCFAMTCSL